MPKIRFIHASDLHIGTPFKGLSSSNGELAAKLKDATFRSFQKIVDLCIEKEVDFLVIAGDVFDSENKFVADQMKFCGELKRLSASGIAAYLICGNHDPLCSWFDTTELPPNVFRFGSAEVESRTFEKDGAPAAEIFGISYQEKTMDRNLAAEFPEVAGRQVHKIALVHATVGDAGPHKNYAPFKIQDILAKGYDYWALGHVHKSAVVSASHPAVVYSGNPQGRDFGETGVKGCYLVELENGAAPKLEFLPAHLVRFEALKIDISGLASVDALSQVIEQSTRGDDGSTAGSDPAARMLRVTLEGRTSLHTKLNRPGETEQIAGYLNDGQVGRPDFVWIDSLEVQTRPDINIAELEAGNDFVSEILKTFGEYESDPERLDELFQGVRASFIFPEAAVSLPDDVDAANSDILESSKWKLVDAFVGQ